MKYDVLDLHYYNHGKYIIYNVVEDCNTEDIKFQNVSMYDSYTTTYVVIKKYIFILVYKVEL